MSKIQTNVMQARNRVIAERRRRGWEPDENSPLIGGSRENEESDNISFTSQLSMPFMVRKITSKNVQQCRQKVFLYNKF